MKSPSLTHRRPTARWFTPALATILIVLASSVAQGKTFNVANLAELNAALKDARPGDSIVMADGAWRDVVINFSAQATAERPVTLRAQTPGKVFLTGASKLSLDSPFLVDEMIRIALFAPVTPASSADRRQWLPHTLAIRRLRNASEKLWSAESSTMRGSVSR